MIRDRRLVCLTGTILGCMVFVSVIYVIMSSNIDDGVNELVFIAREVKKGNDNIKPVVPDKPPVDVDTKLMDPLKRFFYNPDRDVSYLWFVTDTHTENAPIQKSQCEICTAGKVCPLDYHCINKNDVYKPFWGYTFKALEETLEYIVETSKEQLPNDYGEKMNLVFGGDIFRSEEKQNLNLYDTFFSKFRNVKEETGWRILPCVGNHDKGSVYTNDLSTTWGGFDFSDEEMTFIKSNGGMYVTSIGHHRILVLDLMDPKSLDIATTSLEKAKQENSKVLVIGHCPPQSGWAEGNVRQNIFQLFQKYKDTVASTSFYGHEHTHFFYTHQNDHTSVVLPSLNNFLSGIGLSLIKLDAKTLETIDILIFHNDMAYKDSIDLTQPTPFKELWKPILSYHERYGVEDLSPKSFNEVKDIITKNKEELRWFSTNVFLMGGYKYDSKVDCAGPCNALWKGDNCLGYATCRLNYVTWSDQYKNCFNQLSPRAGCVA